MKSSNSQFSWLLQMAWRDSRRSRGKLLLFVSSIILGVSALVAIQSFGHNLRDDIARQAKNLLGSDLNVSSRDTFSQEALQLLDSLSLEQAKELTFTSMVIFPESGDSRLAQVHALEGDFPFYGKLNTYPEEVGNSFQEGKKALVARSLMLQLDIHVGDTVQVGQSRFEIAAQLLQVPGSNSMAAMVSAPVYIPMRYLEETGLIRKGSRVRYLRHLRMDPNLDLTEVETMMEDGLGERMHELKMRYDTVAERQEELGEAFGNMTSFLNLVAFIALLLGCVGVASSVHIYVREKIASVAVLRCLGASGRSAFMIFLVQIAIMGFIGSIIGAILGSQIQKFLPAVLAVFLPFKATISLSWTAIGAGVLTGMGIALLFALWPLLPLRRISPLYTLRAAYGKEKGQKDPMRWVVGILILLFVTGFTYWQIPTLKEALGFVLFLAFAFFVLLGGGKLLMWLTRKYFPVKWNYLWRQSLANLYRPNNQTLVLMLCIGLGSGMIATLYFTQNMLLQTVEITAAGDRPNLLVYDIQTDQIDSIQNISQNHSLEVKQVVPIITMRLAGLNGRTRTEMLDDTTDNISRRTLNREFRITFRDSLIDSETLTKGKWKPDSKDSIFVSIEAEYAQRDLNVDIGDEIVFDLQGREITTYVGSFREIDWQRVQTNFRVLFPPGVLEEAPQFKVLIARTESYEQAADFQRNVMRAFPGVSIVDLGLIINTVEQVLKKVNFVVRFMALFSIITGLLVLIGSVIVSKFQRIQESVLLRTLGGSRGQILAINALEYFFLGLLATGTGILLALLATWGLAYFAFDLTFVPQLGPMVSVFLVITGLTVLIGMLNSREVVTRPPLEVLRREV